MQSVNPATGEVLESFEELSEGDLEAALTTAADTFSQWSQTELEERSRLLRAAAEQLRDNAATFGELITQEMGKPLGEARGEVEKCAWVCEYYADNGADFLADEPHASDALRSYVRYAPLGPVLAIMPWNFPFWQVFRAAAPTLMAGNVLLLKHASNVPTCAQAIADVFTAAGFPQGACTNLAIGASRVEGVIRDSRVAAVTLTGSEAAGRKVAAVAGESLKKTVLELGGSDPFIVLEGTDLDEAARIAATARTINSGQSCIAAKRFIVADAVAVDFVARFREHLEALKVGDPTAEDTHIGPQARGDLRDELHRQVRESVDAGAHCLLGGKLPEGPGYFYPVTLLDHVTEGMTVAREETFGPVAPVIRVADADEAVAVANRSRFGLGGAVFGPDADSAERVARRLESGAAFANGLVKSDPRLPFGGIKDSGYGRELGRHGIREFTNTQTIWVA
jgi:succinate-semialdehyde dehydrogenase/glutarate-semialdehyde dehydrogenase